MTMTEVTTTTAAAATTTGVVVVVMMVAVEAVAEYLHDLFSSPLISGIVRVNKTLYVQCST
jgi:hypothetical protein